MALHSVWLISVSKCEKLKEVKPEGLADVNAVKCGSEK